MAWYDAGTVKVTINSATVTGTGTQWLAGARQGEAFVAPDGRLYEVLNIASNTSLTLTKPYLGATATGQKYALAPMQGYVKESADRLAALLLFLQTDLASVLKAADLQASPNDATYGKILTVGRAFGLGSGTASPPNGRDGVNPFGWYYQTTTPTWGGGSFFLDMPYSTSQNAGLRLSTTPYTDDFFLNGGVSGKKEYRPACKLLHDKNIVGDVGAGSVMAVGSNANGTWVKFADGTQICYGVQSFPGNGWNRKTWTYPLEFYSTPVVTASGQGGNGGFASAPILEPYSRELYFTKVNGSPENDSWANFACVAIGRHKA